MASLMKKYNVTTERALLQAIADDYNRECFDPEDTTFKWDETKQDYDEVPAEPFTVRDAELMLDGMLEAEYQKLASR
jgi:hypothetical protein